MATTPEIPRADVQALVAAVASALQEQAEAPVRFVDQYGARVVAVHDATTAACDAILAACWRPPLPDSETEPGSFADAFLRASADTADMDVISARMAAEGWQEKRAVRVDRETEWGRRWPDGTVRAISNSQAQAEDTIFPTTQLVRREVGPWIEVTS